MNSAFFNHGTDQEQFQRRQSGHFRQEVAFCERPILSRKPALPEMTKEQREKLWAEMREMNKSAYGLK